MSTHRHSDCSGFSSFALDTTNANSLRSFPIPILPCKQASKGIVPTPHNGSKIISPGFVNDFIRKCKILESKFDEPVDVIYHVNEIETICKVKL